MATPPRVTETELARTLHRIAARREKHQDSALERLPDPEQAHPWEMLEFLRRHPAGTRDGRRADVADALRLCAWLWWAQRRAEHTWLSQGRRLGMFLSQLGMPFGIGKRGVADRLDRLEALLRYDRPDEKITREARAAEHARAARSAAEHAWITQHHVELRELATTLAGEAERFALADEHREWVDEAARDAREDTLTPGTLTALGLAAADVQTAPEITALQGGRPYTVHQVLERIHALRADFAALS